MVYTENFDLIPNNYGTSYIFMNNFETIINNFNLFQTIVKYILFCYNSIKMNL